jgi:hypothetical protein
MNRLIIRTVAAALALAATGCSSAVTDVSGKVTYQGKPVVYGAVVIVGSDGLPRSGTIEPDGTYRVSGVAVGPAKVAVSSPKPPGSEPTGPRRPATRDDSVDPDKIPPPPPPPAPPEVIRSWTAIPDKYGDPGKSDLTADVRPGQPLDLDLK